MGLWGYLKGKAVEKYNEYVEPVVEKVEQEVVEVKTEAVAAYQEYVAPVVEKVEQEVVEVKAEVVAAYNNNVTPVVNQTEQYLGEVKDEVEHKITEGKQIIDKVVSVATTVEQKIEEKGVGEFVVSAAKDGYESMKDFGNGAVLGFKEMVKEQRALNAIAYVDQDGNPLKDTNGDYIPKEGHTQQEVAEQVALKNRADKAFQNETVVPFVQIGGIVASPFTGGASLVGGTLPATGVQLVEVVPEIYQNTNGTTTEKVLAVGRGLTYGPLIDQLTDENLADNITEHPARTLGNLGMATIQAVAPLEAARLSVKGIKATANEVLSSKNSKLESYKESPYTRNENGITIDQNLLQKAYESQGIKGDYITYPCRDEFKPTIITKGQKFCRLEPGGEYFILIDEVAKPILASGDATRISEGCQVAPDPIRGYRTQMTIWEAKEDFCAPTGTALNNGQYGKGGLTQAYIPGWDKVNEIHKLQEIGAIEKVDGQIKLTNGNVSRERLDVIEKALEIVVKNEKGKMKEFDISVNEISDTLQKHIEENGRGRAIGQPGEIQKQLQIDQNDTRQLKSKLESIDTGVDIAVNGPIVARSVLQQSEVIANRVQEIIAAQTREQYLKLIIETSMVHSKQYPDVSSQITIKELGDMADKRIKVIDNQLCNVYGKEMHLQLETPLTSEQTEKARCLQEKKELDREMQQYTEDTKNYNEHKPGWFDFKAQNIQEAEYNRLNKWQQELSKRYDESVFQGQQADKNLNTPEALQAIQIRAQQEIERLEKLNEVRREIQTLSTVRQEQCAILSKTYRLSDHNQTITLAGDRQDPEILTKNAPAIEQQLGELKEMPTAVRQIGWHR